MWMLCLLVVMAGLSGDAGSIHPLGLVLVMARSGASTVAVSGASTGAAAGL